MLDVVLWLERACGSRLRSKRPNSMEIPQAFTRQHTTAALGRSLRIECFPSLVSIRALWRHFVGVISSPGAEFDEVVCFRYRFIMVFERARSKETKCYKDHSSIRVFWDIQQEVKSSLWFVCTNFS